MLTRIDALKEFCDRLIKDEAEKLGIHSTYIEAHGASEYDWFRERVKALDLLFTTLKDWVSRADAVVALFKGAESFGPRGMKLIEEISNFDKRVNEDE